MSIVAEKDAERHEAMIIKLLVADGLDPTHPLVLRAIRLARANRKLVKE